MLFQELTRVALRQKQLREQHYAHINGIKIHNQWRKIMRLAKIEELRTQVEILSQTHEREVDRKDAQLQLLDHDLEEAEEQHQAALRAHLIVIDRLLDLQAARLAGLEAQYNSDLRDLQKELTTERTELIERANAQKKELQEIAEAMKAEFADAESDARQEFESAREEVRNRNSEEYNVLKIQLEGIIDELERHFEQAHKAYLEGTEHRTSSFKNLTQNDAAAAHVIEQRMKKLMKLQEHLQHWRTKIATNSREWEERNGALRKEKELMAKHYAQLKAALDTGRGAAAERLKQLSVMSSTAMQDLRSKLSRAESLLKSANSTFAPAVGLPKLNTAGVDDEGRAVEEWDYLNRFFKRYNKVVLDVAAVDRERSRLTQENADLRQLLKNFLDGISVNETVLNTPANPLLVINQRLQLVMAERRKQRSAQQAKVGQPQESRLVSARTGTPVFQLQGGGLISVQAVSSTPTKKQSR
eukprot:gene8068-8263_t